MPQPLSKLFSNRAADIDVAADEMIEKYVEEHGHRPRGRMVNKIRDRASLATRPRKHVHSLAELAEGWRAKASAHLKTDATRWAGSVASNPPARLLRADDVPLDVVGDVAQLVLIALGEKRSTWRRALDIPDHRGPERFRWLETWVSDALNQHVLYRYRMTPAQQHICDLAAV